MRSNFVFILFLVVFSFNLDAKDILVYFESKNDTLKIDSVAAINLSTNQKITFPGNTTLVLKDTTILNTDNQLLNPSTRIFPNPFFQNSTLQIKSDIVQEVKIKMFDLYGQTILQTSEILFPGIVSFSISFKNNGIYFISVQTNSGLENFKIMQLKPGSNNICQKNNNGFAKNSLYSQKSIHNNQVKKFADNRTENSFWLNYKVGDIVLFKCKSGLYETIVTASPDSSISVIPEFVKCVDFDKNSYPVVKIGDQIWMAKNLTTNHYNNGDLIPSDIENNVWVNLKTGASAVYLNDPKHIPNYGLLYNWFAVNDERGVCPVGWHVSDNREWDILLNYLGGPEIAGGKLKATGTEFWTKPNFGADNSSGFSALPSSGRNLDGVAYNDGHDCFYWMADEKDSAYAYNRYIYYNRTLVTKVFHTKVDGFAIRCIKDE